MFVCLTSYGLLTILHVTFRQTEVSAWYNIPGWFDEVVCGLMLGDGTIRKNGKFALLGIQQTHEELVETIWAMCSCLKLVHAPILEINRSNWKTIYSFQTLTLPYFT